MVLGAGVAPNGKKPCTLRGAAGRLLGGSIVLVSNAQSRKQGNAAGWRRWMGRGRRRVKDEGVKIGGRGGRGGRGKRRGAKPQDSKNGPDPTLKLHGGSVEWNGLAR